VNTTCRQQCHSYSVDRTATQCNFSSARRASGENRFSGFAVNGERADGVALWGVDRWSSVEQQHCKLIRALIAAELPRVTYRGS